MRPLSDLGSSGRRPEEVSQNENNYLDTVAAGISRTDNPVRYRLIFRNYGESMNWTTDYPTKPGFYWIRNYRHYAKGHDGPEPIQLIEETVTLSGEPDLRFYFFGDDILYPLSSIDSAEWQGPIEPESEKRNRPEAYHIQGLACKDCGQTDRRFVYWILNTVDGRPIHGIICRECWIKRLTPEQRKVYMV